MLRVSYFGMTDQGRKRSTNQDQFLLARLHKSMTVDHTSIAADQHARFIGNLDGRLLMVADGMGGHAGGELASQLAVDAASQYVLNTIPWFYRLSHESDNDFRDELKRALEHCQQQIAVASDASPKHRGMGTTLTMGYFVECSLYLVHVGDSRCYLIRDGAIHRLTRDHTLAQHLVDEGKLNPEMAEISPLSHCLWNAIGGSDASSLCPDVLKTELFVGDLVLLCTDGLTRHVADEDILTLSTKEGKLSDRCAALVEAANRGGGSDNITVVLAAMEREDQNSAGESIESCQEGTAVSMAESDA